MTSEIGGLLLRSATPEDAERLVEIYAPYVLTTAITFEYEVPTVDEFRERIRRTLERYPYLVAELDGVPVGYAYASAFHARAAYQWCAEASIYIAQGYHKHGIGRALYEALEEKLKARHFLNLNTCVACPQEDNDPYLTRNSIDFHHHMGYRTIGHFTSCGYKFQRWYHMVWMEKHLGEHSIPPAPITR